MEILNLKLEQFEGPLDLLLSLIQKHKLDIFDIPIADLTDQYLAYIDAMEAYNMEVSSDFILMASKLTLIKSKMLLPAPPEEEDPRQPLVDALLEHQRAKIAAEFLKRQSDEFFDRFAKDPDEGDGIYERRHSIELLREAFESVCRRTPAVAEHKVELFEKLENEHFFTVEEKLIFVLRFLFDEKPHEFMSVFDSCRTVGETVAVFLALLQLTRSGRIDIFREEDGLIYLKLIKKLEKTDE